MNAEVVTQLMVAHQLLSEDVFKDASSDYQKNCLVLQQIGLMDVEAIVCFSTLLLTIDSQKHIGTMLIEGE